MNILSLISQNLDNFYRIQTNRYSTHLMCTVALVDSLYVLSVGSGLGVVAHIPREDTPTS
jgi:hypothetical protein